MGIHATREQAEEVKERITQLLCPDPDHAPPCPIPWSVLLLDAAELDDPDAYADLVEQAEIERNLRP
nr:hypothetical protein [Streptomyces sp. SID5643]